MSVTNKVEVDWEFDIETNEEIWSRLELTEGEVMAMLEDEHDASKLKDLCCGELGVPRYVDLDLFFDDYRKVDEETITDTLSDEYGWLIKSWSYVQRR